MGVTLQLGHNNNSWLEMLLSRIKYRRNWRFSLAGSWPGAAGQTGPCLQITALVEDSTTGADLNLTHIPDAAAPHHLVL